jgi:hypothetical protein
MVISSVNRLSNIPSGCAQVPVLLIRFSENFSITPPEPLVQDFYSFGGTRSVLGGKIADPPRLNGYNGLADLIFRDMWYMSGPRAASRGRVIPDGDRGVIRRMPVEFVSGWMDKT